MDSDRAWSSPVLLLASLYDKLQEYKRVENICREALTRNPLASDIANRLLSLFDKQERYAEAQQVLQELENTEAMGAGVASAWQVRLAIRSGDSTRAIDELKLRVANNEDLHAPPRFGKIGRLGW